LRVAAISLRPVPKKEGRKDERKMEGGGAVLKLHHPLGSRPSSSPHASHDTRGRRSKKKRRKREGKKKARVGHNVGAGRGEALAAWEVVWSEGAAKEGREPSIIGAVQPFSVGSSTG